MRGRATPNIDELVIPSPWPVRTWDRIAEAADDLALDVDQRLAGLGGRRRLLLRHLSHLIWWTLTLRLPTHAAYWVSARRKRRAAAMSSHDRQPGSHDRQPDLPLAPPLADHIHLRLAADPEVSVIIPTYGQVPCTLRCLAAIAAHPPSATIEVIVIDDASPDPAVALLDQVEGIRLIRQPRNLGYLLSCNEAAKSAVGTYLLFLNNDTEPRAMWLDAMLALATSRPNVGAVGAKLVYPDGRLQEAGGIIWNDATGWNYGRGEDPANPEYNYVREVDYCSGAALLVPRGVFAALNGFDARYTPAYFEDSDLAFRLREAGYTVLYEPRAVVMHHEGVSHGTDIRTGVKAYQEINRDTFRTRWADVLATQHLPPGSQVLRARDRVLGQVAGLEAEGVQTSAQKQVPQRVGQKQGAQKQGAQKQGAPKQGAQKQGAEKQYAEKQVAHRVGTRELGARPVVLIIDHHVPEPDRDAGSTVTLGFIRALLHAGAVVKFWSDSPTPRPAREAVLQDLSVEVQRGDLWAFGAWVRVNGSALDHVLLSRPDVSARYLPLVRRHSRARIAYLGHDLHYDRMRQQALLEGDASLARAAQRMLRLERRAWRGADVVLYLSQAEVEQVVALQPRVVARAVQPYSFADFAPLRRPVKRQLLLFVAGFAHPPNADAACWLAHDIMPLVQRQAPLAHLAIVGSNPTTRVLALADLGVTIAANVGDTELREWYAMARVAVVPLRCGAGVKRKVVEALREGVPLVTTPVGAQGLPGLSSVASVCGTAESIAAGIVALLGDDVLWAERSAAGVAYARAHFSEATLRTSLCRAMGVTDIEAAAVDPTQQTRRPTLHFSAIRSAMDRQGEPVRADQPLSPEPVQRAEALLQVGDQVGDIL